MLLVVTLAWLFSSTRGVKLPLSPTEELRLPLRAAVEAKPSEAAKAARSSSIYHSNGLELWPAPIVLPRASNNLTRSRRECKEGTYTPASQSCSEYLFCVHGKYLRMPCPPGLHWDAEDQICNFPHAVNCQQAEGSRPATQSVIREEESIPTPEDQVSSTETDWNKPWAAPTEPPRPDYNNLPLSNGLSGDYKIVCYFTNWATYRQGGEGKFDPQHIDPNICTHIMYGFAVLDRTTLLIKSHDPYADMSDGYSGKDMYRKVTEFKKYGIKVSLALGGWNDSEGDKYSRLVNNPKARASFIEHVITFLEKHHFDGLDLDWEYPSCWQTDCREERYSDKAGFADWVSELRAAFTPRGLLLSAAVSPSKMIIDLGYDVPSIARDLDWINLMTYDYHGHWEKKTGHVAPFYGHKNDDFPHFNANFSVNYWIESGAPASKLVMGMPLYGQSFTLADKKEHGLNSPARGGGTAGPATRAQGFLAYHEICRNIQRGWTVVKDQGNPPRMGPYAYYGNQWVGFDDKDMIRRKCEYVRDMGLGGGMVWALDLDDFKNKCGDGKYPLMNTIREVLGPAKRT